MELMRELPIILFGVGGVGQALLRQILDCRGLHAIQYGLHLQLLAVCDSNGAIVEPSEGIADEMLREALTLKEGGGRLADHPDGGPQGDSYSIVDIAGRAGAVVVDCTASDATVPGLLYALERRYRVALANKKPLTIEQEVYDRLTSAGVTPRSNAAAPRHLGASRWEATVGAGLPVIATLNRLVAGGDAVQRIAGTFSGTLGYVMSGLQAGRPFSEIVREAHALGYTEPDPRDDLGGVDVARKALILARGLDWRLDLADVEVEGLYPVGMDKLPVRDFLDQLPALDAQYAERVQAAAAQQQTLRYAATIEDGRCRVGPVTVGLDSPLGRLVGTDNLVEFHTRWYNPTPLVIQGRGAGVDATAAAVLSDIIELAFAAS
ncbi:MAG: homoserine dehydrogenase [Chloroflexota bacterium]|nr:homoserine dehydrogenase [Chloroflexota bacterium]